MCCLSLAFSSCSHNPLLWEQEILCKTLKFCLLSFRFYILTWKCGFKIIYSHLSPLLDPRMKLSPFQEKHNCHNFAQETKNFKSLEQLILYAIKLLFAEKLVWKLFSLVLFCRWRNLSQFFWVPWSILDIKRGRKYSKFAVVYRSSRSVKWETRKKFLPGVVLGWIS